MPVFPAPALQPWVTQLRDWQVEAARSFAEIDERDRLWIVTPGGGKTLGAGRVIHGALKNNWAGGALFVVPRTPLRGQVARALSRNGVHLDHGFSNDNPYLTDGFHGAVVTYAQVASNPQVFQNLCRDLRPIVVLDEVHHASEMATWGEALALAFDAAEIRLSMSGTPFRSDEAQIPFVRYDDAEVLAHYSYDYVRAIADDVCRLLEFGFFDGMAEWISRSGERKRATFADKLDARGRSERLRTHLLTDAIGDVLRVADQKLLDVREREHVDAAGLVVCMTQEHAKAIAETLYRITGERPELVVSADSTAGARLHAFATSGARWLVAVHMVSEGIDIPRLRVGVFASNVRTEMYLRQFFGRFVRKQAHYANDKALIFLPADPEIKMIAQNVHREAKVGIKARSEKLATSEHPQKSVSPDLYKPLGSTLDVGSSVQPIAREAAVSLVERREQLRKDISKLAGQVAYQNNVEKRKVFQTLWYQHGGSQDRASVENLEERLERLQSWLKNGYNGYM